MSTSSYPRLFNEYAPPRRRLLLDEPGKTICEGPDPSTYVLYFKDDILFEKETIIADGKGAINNRISELLMTRLNDLKVETHFIRMLNMREQLVRATEALPFVVTVHNIASGDFARRLGLEEESVLPKPIPEFSLRSKDLHHSVVATEHVTSLGWCRFEDIDDILLSCQRMNDFLTGQFLALGIRLMNFKIGFGRFYTSDLVDSQVIVIDEICPDTCSLLDLKTGKRLDWKAVQDNPESACEIYREVARRFGILEEEVPEEPITAVVKEIFTSGKPLFKQSINRRKNPNGHNSI